MRRKQENILTVTKIRDIPFIRVVSGINIVNDFPKHIHADLCIGIITHGKRIISAKGKSMLLDRDDIFVINPGEPHGCISPEMSSHSYVVINIEQRLISDIAKKLSIYRKEIIFENYITDKTDLTLRMKRLIDTLLNSNMLLDRESRLYSFLEMLIRYHSSSKKEIPVPEKRNSIIQKAKGHIDNNFIDEISLDELSQISGVSPFYLNRLFCSEVGISPHSYQIHRRIEKSKELLLKSGSIAEVSLNMGFTDQSHFSKFFRKIVGATPGNYIKHNMV